MKVTSASLRPYLNARVRAHHVNPTTEGEGSEKACEARYVAVSES
jgi:hypothetical protein